MTLSIICAFLSIQGFIFCLIAGFGGVTLHGETHAGGNIFLFCYGLLCLWTAYSLWFV